MLRKYRVDSGVHATTESVVQPDLMSERVGKLVPWILVQIKSF